MEELSYVYHSENMERPRISLMLSMFGKAFVKACDCSLSPSALRSPPQACTLSGPREGSPSSLSFLNNKNG